MSHSLDPVNLTELIQLCRDAGLGNIGRNTPREEIYEALENDTPPKRSCPLDGHRQEMEAHIHKNFNRIRTQLPGCNGKCASFGCPDLIVLRCWEAMKGDIL